MEGQAEKEIYDAIILGTGIKESILAGLLSNTGAKVMQMDSSPVYGSSSRTIQYTDFVQEMANKFPMQSQFVNIFGEKEASKICIDLTPKIFLADEGLIKIIAEHNLAHCIEFSIISEQYIIKDEKPILIPTTKTAALTSKLCGPLQIIKLHRFVSMIKGFYNAEDREKQSMTAQWKTVHDLYEYYGISHSLRSIIGHGIALYTSDEYLKSEPSEFIHRLTTYFRSVARINGEKTGGNSPFLYPKYGISEISQGFARLSAVKGGVTRMGTEILKMDMKNGAHILDIKTEGQKDTVYTKFIIANDQYYATVPDVNTKKVYTLRGVYILKALPNSRSKQAMLVLPGHPGIFLLVIGKDEEMCPEGYSIAYITAEYSGTEEELESIKSSYEIPYFLKEIVAPAVNQLYAWKYSIMQQFVWIDEASEGITDLIDKNVISLKPMDNTVDFRTVLAEVEHVYSLFSSTIKM
ncbi:Rab GDP dissociation inhibitor [Nematocida sp. ERTm5]|nr:Rab GDP dissociation inhibitor [Nematocida sp. ERTm5]